MPRPDTNARPFGTALLVAMVAIAMAGQPVAAQAADEPAFIVAVNADGSAELTVRLTFDLTTDEEQQAFETLQDDDQARQNAMDRFLDRIRAVASDAENATGREMRVTDASIDLRQTSDGETGIVTLGASWSGLAAVEGDTLIITEPFASGFSPERPFVLRAPDGYEIASASPSPDDRSQTSLTWAAGTELAGLSVEFVPTETPTPAGDDGAATDGQPGFGVLVALLGILVAVGGLVGRPRSRGGS